MKVFVHLFSAKVKRKYCVLLIDVSLLRVSSILIHFVILEVQIPLTTQFPMLFLFSREEEVGSMQLKEQLAVDRKEEEVENNYSDDSFEEGDDEQMSSSIEERTPTFEFNLSPPSINISECKDSNQSLGQEKIPRDNEDDTISDISDLENQPVSCEESTDIITRGSLRRQRSSWALFDDDPAGETECKALRDEMVEDCEAIEYERQHYFGDAEMGNERKYFDDEELDRMDDEIFGLLRPSGQSSRASIVFPGDDVVGSQRDTSSRKRRVRIAIEPEVFLVPFSSREFEEPFFEDTESTPEETEIESPWKNMSLDLFYEGSEERKDEGDDCIEEDIPEEICTDDPGSENDYNVGSESNGLVKQGSLSTNVEDTQTTPDVSLTREKELFNNERETAEEGNGSVGADELMKGISAPTVQRHLDFKTDPQSKAFADDLDDLLDSAEEEIQAAIRCGKSNLAAKEYLHFPSEISGSKEEDLSRGIENPPVSIKGMVHLPDDEGKKDISMDEQDSLRRSEQEEIPEESISEEINLAEFDIGTQSFFITSTVVKSKDETLFNTTITDELKFDGKGLLKPVTEHKHHSENNSDDIKGNDQVQEKDICLESNSDTIPCQKTSATESIAFKVRLHNAKQKEFQTMKEGTETDIIQEDYVERQKKFDEQAASMTFENGNVLKAAQGYGSGETFHSTEGEDDDKECGPAVSEQNSRENENASHHGFVKQEKGEHLIKDDSLYNVTDQAIDESSNTRKDCEVKKVKTTMPEVLKKSAYTRTKSFSFENERAGKKVAYSDDQYVNDLHAEIKALREINDQLRYELNDKDEEKYTIECMINSANIENEKLMEQLDNLESEMQTLRSEKENTELELNRSRDREMEFSQEGCSLEDLHREFKALKSYNKELEIQLEENSKQRRNMDFVVEQVNLENESLLERLDGLESELKEATFSKKALEAEITECKESLEQKKYENESLSQDLEKLKDLHARTDSKILELSGKKKAYENFFGESDTVTSLSLAQEIKQVSSSFVQMSNEVKDIMLKVLEDSQQHQSDCETNLKRIKEEYLQTVNLQNNFKFRALKQGIEELKVQLEDNGNKAVNSTNIEREKLLERVDGLENKLKAVLKEKDETEQAAIDTNAGEKQRKKELVSLRDAMRMETKLDQERNERKALEEKFRLMSTQCEQSEAAKLMISEKMDKITVELEMLKSRLRTNLSDAFDYSYLREEVELLKGSIMMSERKENAWKKALKSREMGASSVSYDTEFSDQKEPYKNRDEKERGEFAMGNSLILQDLEQSWGKLKPSGLLALRNLEKQMRTIYDELRQLREENIRILRKGEKEKKCYKKVKKRFAYNERDIKFLKQSFEKEVREEKEDSNELKSRIQKDMEQIRLILKRDVENKEDHVNKIMQSVDKRLVEQMNVINALTDRTLLSLESNQLECEVNKSYLKNEKAQEMENRFFELKRCLQEKEFDLDNCERKLKEKEGRIEELHRQLLTKEERNKLLRRSLDEAKSSAINQVKDKEREIIQLRQLVTDGDKNVEMFKEKFNEMSEDLENAKGTIAQRETELMEAKASLCKGDELLNMFKDTLIEIQQELQLSKRELMEKDAALERAERHIEVLLNSAKTKTQEIGVTNELVHKVVRDVEQVEKLKQGRGKMTFDESPKQMTTIDKLLCSDQLNAKNEEDGLINQERMHLEKKDKAIEKLQSDVTQLKEDLDRATYSLKEKDIELKRLIEYFKKEEEELGIANGKIRKLEEENDVLQNKLKQLNAILSQKDDEMKSLKHFAFKRDSELTTLNKDSEKLKFLVQESEQAINFMKQEIAEKEHERKSLKENLQTKMAEIRCLREELEYMKIDKCKALGAYPGLIEHMKATGKTEKELEDLRHVYERKVCDDKERKIYYLEGVVERLQRELTEKKVFLEKFEELSTANVGIQVKEEQVYIVEGRLGHLDETFEVYKQNTSESESMLGHEKISLDHKVDEIETRLCQRQKEIKELKYSLQTKMSEFARSENKREREVLRIPVNKHCNSSEVEMAQLASKQPTSAMADRMQQANCSKHCNSSEVEMAQLASKQPTSAMADRMQQVSVNMNTMHIELESSRKENTTMTKKNKALKERAETLQKQIVQNDQEHFERLNNVLDNVRLKRKEIHGLKALLGNAQDKIEVPEVSWQYS